MPWLISEDLCSIAELEQFIGRSRKYATGWIGFYWGKPPEELRRSSTVADALTLAWLEFFVREGVPDSPSTQLARKKITE